MENFKVIGFIYNSELLINISKLFIDFRKYNRKNTLNALLCFNGTQCLNFSYLKYRIMIEKIGFFIQSDIFIHKRILLILIFFKLKNIYNNSDCQSQRQI